MHYFNGFSLRAEKHFFSEYLIESDYTVAGFSYGAIKAVEFASVSQERIDTLQLFSPAFFQSKPKRFKSIQLEAYQKNAMAYFETFITNCFAPYGVKKIDHVLGTTAQLEELLYHVWDLDMLDRLVKKGIKIEVYLGSADKIIDVESAKALFLPYATTFLIKHANHFLLTKENYAKN